MRIFNPAGKWIAENSGVSPDVEVDLYPKAVAEGRDPQRERAVAIHTVIAGPGALLLTAPDRRR